ncbi:hypothetical protein C8R46DRAFT_139052 [Mycena filopes]|nr:hypothetical protein C8R46DRAFT_139052 [Mycena filopes]
MDFMDNVPECIFHGVGPGCVPRESWATVSCIGSLQAFCCTPRKQILRRVRRFYSSFIQFPATAKALKHVSSEPSVLILPPKDRCVFPCPPSSISSARSFPVPDNLRIFANCHEGKGRRHGYRAHGVLKKSDRIVVSCRKLSVRTRTDGCCRRRRSHSRFAILSSRRYSAMHPTHPYHRPAHPSQLSSQLSPLLSVRYPPPSAVRSCYELGVLSICRSWSWKSRHQKQSSARASWARYRSPG